MYVREAEKEEEKKRNARRMRFPFSFRLADRLALVNLGIEFVLTSHHVRILFPPPHPVDFSCLVIRWIPPLEGVAHKHRLSDSYTFLMYYFFGKIFPLLPRCRDLPRLPYLIIFSSVSNTTRIGFLRYFI